MSQARFELLARESLPDIAGFQILTIRDNRIGACFTVFMLQPPAPNPPLAVPSDQSLEAAATADILQRVRDAAAKRDQQLAELRNRFGGVNPKAPGLAYNEYENALMQVEDEFGRALAPLLPGTYRYATKTPGTRSGGWENAAENMRRGLTDPDPTTFRTFADSGALNAQFEFWFRQMVESPRLTSSGPAPCEAPAKRN